MLREKLKFLTIRYKLQSYLKKDIISYYASTAWLFVSNSTVTHCLSWEQEQGCEMISAWELGAPLFEEKHWSAHTMERNIVKNR